MTPFEFMDYLFAYGLCLPLCVGVWGVVVVGGYLLLKELK